MERFKIYHHIKALGLAILIASASGCSAPPDAPDDYEGLLAYAFTYMDDETGQIEDGLVKLHDYIQDDMKRTSATDGFSIDLLTEEAVDNLDGTDHSAADLLGVTVVTPSPHTPEVLGKTLVWDGFAEIIEDNVDFYNRTFVQPDTKCFWDKSCDWLEAEGHTKSQWGGFIAMETRYTIQFRWVETEKGWVLLHRQWLKERADGECCDVIMYEAYYIGVNLIVNGKSQRIHARWFNIDSGPGGFLAGDPNQNAIDAMRDDAVMIDQWITDNPERIK